MKWKLIAVAGPEIRDGREVIVAVNMASVWVVRLASWGGCDDPGWRSSIHSVSSEILEGEYEPTHYLDGAPDLPRYEDLVR